MPDAFTDSKRITKSHIPAVNVPIRINVPKGPCTSVIASESQIRLKRGRPLGSKDKNPRKRSIKNDTTKESHEEIQDLINPDIPEEISEPETQVNEKLSISSTGDEISLDRSKIIVENVFAYDVALNIMKGNEDLEPLSVEECRQRCDWPKWQEAIQSELNSLAKREVFGPVVQTPSDVKSIGYKWVFV